MFRNHTGNRQHPIGNQLQFVSRAYLYHILTGNNPNGKQPSSAVSFHFVNHADHSGGMAAAHTLFQKWKDIDSPWPYSRPKGFSGIGSKRKDRILLSFFFVKFIKMKQEILRQKIEGHKEKQHHWNQPNKMKFHSPCDAQNGQESQQGEANDNRYLRCDSCFAEQGACNEDIAGKLQIC